MKIITLNIRHGGGKRIENICQYFSTVLADIIIITEYRDNEYGETLKKLLQLQGYTYMYHYCVEKNKNSCLIVSKIPYIYEYFPELGEHQQRVIKISNEKITIIGVYFPLNHAKSVVFDFLNTYLEQHSNDTIIIGGDRNTGQHYVDELGATFIHEKSFVGLSSKGVIDAWRYIHNDKKEFTRYSNKGNGFRLDHFFISDHLKNSITSCIYDHIPREQKISDHSALILDITI